MLYDFTARMHEDDIVYIHQRAQRAGIALKTKYSPLVDIALYTLHSPSTMKNFRIMFEIFRRTYIKGTFVLLYEYLQVTQQVTSLQYDYIPHMILSILTEHIEPCN